MSPSSAYHTKYNVLFFGEPHSNSIRCINRRKFFTTRNMATAFKDNKHLNYPHSMNIDVKGNMFIFSNEWPLFAAGEIKRSSMEYSIYRCKVRDLIRGNICDNSTPRSGLMGLLGLNPKLSYDSVDIYDSKVKDPLD